MRALLVLVVSVLAGCTGASHAVPEEYRPLKRVTESSLRSDGFITTIGETAYVNDLDTWLGDHPVGSPRYRATLRHESTHSRRQHDTGLATWLNQYLTDTEFMWQEETIGWYQELITLRDNGVYIDVNHVADVLASYKNLSGRMVTREKALTWVTDVLAGRWRPAN